MYNTKSKSYVFVCMHTHRLLDLFQRPLRLHPLPLTPVFTLCASVLIVPMIRLQVFSFLLLVFFLIYH